VQQIDTVVIGAGQAGLATSRLLAEAGRDHVVLERGRIGQRWHERWDSLRLLTPNWMTRLPGHTYTGDDPDGFMRAAELAATFERYASSFDAPIREEVTVLSVRRAGERGYLVDTTAGRWRADNVVIATGWFTDPVVPSMASCLDRSIEQLHANRYRNPSALPDGNVLVVGASASGAQIADELARAGRAVTIAVGRHSRMPRTYRGHDAFWWLDRAGVLEDRADDMPEQARLQPSLQVVGRHGANLDLGTLADLGVRVTGRLQAVDGSTVALADDLVPTLADADRRLHRLLDRVEAATGPAWGADRPAPIVLPPAPARIHLPDERITTVIWATGHRPSFPWLHVPVLDASGAPRQRNGMTESDGLYVVGMRWQTRRSSHFIDGVRHDAAIVVDHIVGRRDEVAA
jgi:putative flavoprotein involved in K+ transport